MLPSPPSVGATPNILPAVKITGATTDSTPPNSMDHTTEEAEFGVWSLGSKYHNVGVEEESMKKHLI